MSRSAQREADAGVVVAFLNTYDVETGADEIVDQVGWEVWVAGHDLGAPGPLAAARAVRDGLRSVAGGDRWACDLTVPAAVGLVDGRPRTVALDAPGAILLAAARLADAGDWARIKLCAAATCRWAFVDESRNRSRAWCSMEVCGNRAKARAFRSRARTDGD